jgi:hypothetical protein
MGEEKKCIIRHNGYNLYFYKKGCHGSEFLKAKRYNGDNIPKYIRDNPKNEIIFLDSKEGLELLVNEGL